MNTAIMNTSTPHTPESMLTLRALRRLSWYFSLVISPALPRGVTSGLMLKS